MWYNRYALPNAAAEVQHQVRRLAHHPCIALWLSNNEIVGPGGHPTGTRCLKGTERTCWQILFIDTVFAAVLAEDGGSPFPPFPEDQASALARHKQALERVFAAVGGEDSSEGTVLIVGHGASNDFVIRRLRSVPPQTNSTSGSSSSMAKSSSKLAGVLNRCPPWR